MPPVDALVKEEIDLLRDYIYTFNNARIAFGEEEHVFETLEKAIDRLSGDLSWLKNLQGTLSHRTRDMHLKDTVFEAEDDYDFSKDFEAYRQSMHANITHILSCLKALGKIVCWIENRNHKLDQVLLQMRAYDEKVAQAGQGVVQKEFSTELTQLRKVIAVVEQEESEFSKLMKTIQEMIRVLEDCKKRLYKQSMADHIRHEEDLYQKTREQMEFLSPLLKQWGHDFFKAKQIDKRLGEEFNLAKQLMDGIKAEKEGAEGKFESQFKSTYVDILG